MKANPYWLNGERVREAAKGKPFTLKQMSEELGFDSRVLYCYMQNAYKIPLDRLEGIAKYLNVSLESLIKEDDSDDSVGFGYMVCDECYEKEWELRKVKEGKNE